MGGLGAVLASVGRGIANLAKLIVSHRVSRIVAIVVVVVVVAGIADTAANWNKIYGGVKIGTVDVSGMTREEASSAVRAAYQTGLEQTTAMIYADEEAKAYVADEVAQAEDKAQAEQISVEEARNENKLWTATYTSVGGSIPYDELSEEALEVGRSNGGVLARLGSLILGTSIAPRMNYDSELIDSLGSEIDETLGDERIDADVDVDDGEATVIAPHDGMMVNRETLKSKLTEIFTKTNAEGSFIAWVELAPSRTTIEQAQSTADAINRAIVKGATFTYGDTRWTADDEYVGDWIVTKIVPDGDGYKIAVGIDSESAKKDIMNNVSTISADGPVEISFEKTGSGIMVETSGNTTAPDVSKGADDLNTCLFGENGLAWASNIPATAPEIALDSTQVAQSLTLDEALSLGLVTAIGTYTTEYSTYSGTENRNFNIHHAADLINYSIAKADGGEWSFNDTAGYCNEEAGFKSAGIILDGEYTDSIGGGICQVATTVFNAVYESGLPITQRSNHSLYIQSYPEGRDAAVSYPDLDLIWENDQKSDVLLVTSYTDSTLTVTLYSSPTGLSVKSEVGEWEEGEKYEVKQKVDESLASGVYYLSTVGVNGSSISVTRIVYDKDNEEVRRTTFTSNYDPKDAVVTSGPDTEVDLTKYESD